MSSFSLLPVQITNVNNYRHCRAVASFTRHIGGKRFLHDVLLLVSMAIVSGLLAWSSALRVGILGRSGCTGYLRTTEQSKFKVLAEPSRGLCGNHKQAIAIVRCRCECTVVFRFALFRFQVFISRTLRGVYSSFRATLALDTSFSLGYTKERKKIYMK